MLIVRDITPDDLNLVRDSFVHGAKQIEMTLGMDPALMRTIVDKAILYGWKATILCDDGCKDEIMAWQISEPGHRRLLWLSRKPRYKGMGLGLKLLEMMMKPGIVYCAFINPKEAMLFMEHGYNCRLRPYIATEVASYE